MKVRSRHKKQNTPTIHILSKKKIQVTQHLKLNKCNLDEKRKRKRKKKKKDQLDILDES